MQLQSVAALRAMSYAVSFSSSKNHRSLPYFVDDPSQLKCYFSVCLYPSRRYSCMLYVVVKPPKKWQMGSTFQGREVHFHANIAH